MRRCFFVKKFFALFLTICLLLCLCAGCAGQSDPGSSSKAESSGENTGSSAPEAGNDASQTEEPIDTESPAPAEEADGALWSVSLRELMGKPVKARNIALAGDGVVYAILEEVNEYNIDITLPYLVTYDPAAGEVTPVGWDADYVGRFTVLEDGRIGALADPGDGLRLMRFRLASDVTDVSPVITTSDGETAVSAGYDFYCCNDGETGDLALYDLAAGTATVICPGNGGGSRNAIAQYLSPDGRYAVYIKFQGGLLDCDTVYLYDAETGIETAYPLPTVESDVRPYRPMAAVGDAVYFFENASGKGELTNRCWRMKDGGEPEELALPFQYRNGGEQLKGISGAVIFADSSDDQTEATPVYLLDADGAAYLADYRIPMDHYLSTAAMSGDRLVLSVYEGGHSGGDEVFYLVESGFSRIG